MTHRITACAILFLVGACAFFSRKTTGNPNTARLTYLFFSLILIQATLGAYTVWSNKAADLATAHVAVGALSLVLGGLLYIGTAPLAAATTVRETRSESLQGTQGSPVLS